VTAAVLFGLVFVGLVPTAHGIFPATQTSHAAASSEKARALISKAQVELAKNTEAAMRKAVEFYAQAAQIDPHSAPAQVGLAEACTMLWGFGFMSRQEALPKAEAAALKAVELDPKLADARTTLGALRMREWEWAGAEVEFKRAIELQPSNARCRHWYALFLAAMGRHPEALLQSRRANELEPASPGMMTGLGAILYFARDYDQMIRQMEATTTLDPNFAPGYDWLGMAYVQTGKFPESIAAYEKGVALAAGASEVKAGLGHAYGLAGRREDAKKMLSELNGLAKQKYVPPVQIAFVHLGLGENDRALELLEQAYRERSWELVFIGVEPWVDNLRSDPRFQDLLRRINFPPNKPSS
jgi:tetratricopeptide (TPR) repeat protein